MVFDRTLQRIADRSVKQFNFAGDDLPNGMRKTIMFMLYKAFPFITNIAFFMGTYIGMLYMQHKFGFERVIMFVFAVWLYRSFAAMTKPKKDDAP